MQAIGLALQLRLWKPSTIRMSSKRPIALRTGPGTRLSSGTSPSSSTNEKHKIETVTRHYLDFDVRLSDDLFRPVKRPGEPLE